MRFASVDALRGTTVAAMLLVNNPGDWGRVYAPLRHAMWHGCTPTDLIFPMFLFIVGVSITLSLSPRLERGDPPQVLSKLVMTRAIRIFALGLLLHLCALWAFDLPHYRVMGVLQRIGLCFAIAGMISVFLTGRAQWVLWVVVLLGYAGLLAAGGSYAPFDNLASRVDSVILGVHVYEFDAAGRGHDPEGLLSTLGALATTLLGLRAGDWLRRGRIRLLWLTGAAALIVGYAWSFMLPINKNLWTSSYVLWTGGWACWLLALCHWLIDRRGWPAWGRTFGVNAIAAYAGSAMLLYALAAVGWLEPVYRQGFAAWMTPRVGPYLPSLTYALAFVALWWGLMRWLDARRIYFKI